MTYSVFGGTLNFAQHVLCVCTHIVLCRHTQYHVLS